jgi:hypothetical protein
MAPAMDLALYIPAFVTLFVIIDPSGSRRCSWR